MADRKSYETGSTVQINRDAVSTICQSSTLEKAQELWSGVHKTCVRLGVKKKGTLPEYTFQRTLPSMHSIQRWLDSLTKESDDISFLAALYNTLDSRVPAQFKEKALA